jgi:DNA polymerase-3 subunit delta'
MASSEQFTEIRAKTTELLWGTSSKTDVFAAARYFEDKKEHIDFILETIALFLRDIMVYKETGDENLLINSDKKDIILKNVPFYTVPGLIRQIGAVESTRRNIKRNINFQLSIEVMLMKLMEDCINGKSSRG